MTPLTPMVWDGVVRMGLALLVWAVVIGAWWAVVRSGARADVAPQDGE